MLIVFILIKTFRELGIGIVAYSPLGRGFFSSGPKIVDGLNERDFRRVCIAEMRNSFWYIISAIIFLSYNEHIMLKSRHA